MNLDNMNISKRMEHYNVAGLSMARIDDGQISTTGEYGVLELGLNNIVNRNSIFNACSISKFVTAILVMSLTEQGVLDLDQDVNNRLISWKVPDYPFMTKSKVTLRTLLSHQSGITDPNNSFTELTSIHGIPTITDLLEGKTPYCTESIKVTYEPESDFQYSDAGFCVIQQLIEDVMGRSFTDVMNERVFTPLDIKNSIFGQEELGREKGNLACGHNKQGLVVKGKYPIYPYPAASGLWSTPTDIACLVIELMDALNGKGRLGLSPESAREIITSQGSMVWTGLGLFLERSKQELEISSLGWGVGFQCLMVAYPFKGSGMVIMTNTDLGVHQLKGIIGEIYHSMA
ncbi:serine hydrolase domain-containing protein [Ornithinibacillus salinisoli]|uniref:Serine hydrolase domain-containing protein n=1 Tax=Ornithinibacillus salinisoli TaxID=1848459 RepID=A0ABW4W3T5_9BACI